jgi:hypothetical protein
MSVEAAAPLDRLPWLSDEPQPKPAKRRGGLGLAWAAGAVALVAGAGFWAGERSVNEQPALPAKHPQPTTIVRLPEARPSEQPQVKPAPVTEVERVVAPSPQRLEQPPVVKQTISVAAPEPQQATTSAASAESAVKQAPTPAPSQSVPMGARVPAPASPPLPLRAWPPRVTAGAAGRLVEIGAFGSVPQSKRGWWYMVRAYPAVAHLPAIVSPDRNSKGRIFYRFRVGTTSQAHSEVLCQRMQRIHLSCAVIGLPWKAKVER